MQDISIEYWIWMGLVVMINLIFFLYTVNYIITSYRILANDPSIRIKGVSSAQKFMQKMRWIALIIIILRLIFVIICGLNNGKLPFDHTLDWNNYTYCMYMIFYFLMEEISAEGKVVYVIIIFQRVSHLLLRMYEIDSVSFRTDYKKYKRLKYVMYGGYLAIICDIIHRIAEMLLWIINDNDKSHIWNVGLYGLTYLLFWISFGCFVYNFYEIRARSTAAYHKVAHAMPEYKKLYFQSIFNRLEYTGPLFLLWLIVYFCWSMIDISHHILDTLGFYSNTLEYHIALYWMYWILCDSMLFIAILHYIKPQITPSILQKYSRPINNKRKVSLQHIY